MTLNPNASYDLDKTSIALTSGLIYICTQPEDRVHWIVSSEKSKYDWIYIKNAKNAIKKIDCLNNYIPYECWQKQQKITIKNVSKK